MKPATVNKELATLKHLYTLAMKWKYVSRNPVREVKFLKEPPGRLRYLLPEQVTPLLDACALHSPTFKALVIFARHTGMRQGETLGLTWADVNLREEHLQEAVRLLERGSEESGGYTMATQRRQADASAS